METVPVPASDDDANGGSAEGEERIVVVSKDEIVEADVITGVNIWKLQLRHLTRIQPIITATSNSKPVVELEFRQSLSDRTQCIVCR